MPISTRYKTTKILSYGTKGDDYENWDEKRVKMLMDFANAIEFYSKEEIVYIDLRNPNDVSVQLPNYLVRFGALNDTIVERAKNLYGIIPEIENKNLEKDVSYIDLRWEVSCYIAVKNKSGQIVREELLHNLDDEEEE